MKNKLKSRKLWVAVGGVITVMLTEWLDLSPETSESITKALVTIIVAYLGGQSIVDVAKEWMSKDGEKNK